MIDNLFVLEGLSQNDIIIIIACAFVIVFLVILFFVVYPFLHRLYFKKNFRKTYYRKIRKVADIRDFYLINNLTLRTSNNEEVCNIDHILFGDKYIYVIKDRYINGTVTGNQNDNTWILFSSDKVNHEIPNPMKRNQERVKRLSSIAQIDESFLISIVIVNNDCILKNSKDLNSDNSFIVSSKKFYKLIKLIESRNVKQIDQNSLNFAVQDIYRLYSRSAQNENEN